MFQETPTTNTEGAAMRVSAFTFVRNAIRLDYPIVESISSVLPLVDEFVVNVGDCSDDTPRLIESIGSPKIKILRSRWDPGIRTGGRMLAIQADLALSHCTGDWAVYIQADEVLHEDDLPKVRAALGSRLNDGRVEGLLFDFVHFYGNYHTLGVGRKWYDREIRVVRTGVGISAWRDAQGFRLNGKKLRVVDSGAKIYHYGWARDPARMKAKIVELARWWHDDRTLDDKYDAGTVDFVFNTGGSLAPFRGSHPAVMADRIRSSRPASHAVEAGAVSIRHRLLDWIDKRVGWHPGRYSNYVLLAKEDLLSNSVAGRPEDGRL